MILILIMAVLLVAAIVIITYFSTKTKRENFCSPGAAELARPLYVIKRGGPQLEEDDDADKYHACDACSFTS